MWRTRCRTSTTATLSNTRGRLRRLALLVAASLVAPILGVGGGAPVATAATTTMTETQQSWVDEFSQWNTTRAILTPEVRYMLRSDAAARAGASGTGVDVALIDTGVAPVPGLDRAEQVVNGPDLSLDFQAGITPGLDANGHGTHMASLIAGSNGIATGARVVNMKVGAADGAVDVSQVIASIDWVVQHRRDPGMNIRVISLSYGTDALQSYQRDPLTHAVESAWRNGIVVVVAAGNSGGALTNPAIDPYVLAVGAADTNDPYSRADDVVAPFSSVGTSSRRVDVVAPGVSLLGLRTPGSFIDQANPSAAVLTTFFKGSGTSQASAVTAGAVAQLLSARPELTPDQVKAILRSTARPLALSPMTSQGAGLIDVEAARLAPVPSNAAQSFKRSNGLGSLELARGGSHLVSDTGAILEGEVDLLGAAWKPKTWAPLASAGTAWSGGTWNGNVWTGVDWAPIGTYGSVFSGRSWRSELWTGRSWRADTWLSAVWEGRSWRDGAWS